MLRGGLGCGVLTHPTSGSLLLRRIIERFAQAAAAVAASGIMAPYELPEGAQVDLYSDVNSVIDRLGVLR